MLKHVILHVSLATAMVVVPGTHISIMRIIKINKKQNMTPVPFYNASLFEDVSG